MTAGIRMFFSLISQNLYHNSSLYSEKLTADSYSTRNKRCEISSDDTTAMGKKRDYQQVMQQSKCFHLVIIYIFKNNADDMQIYLLKINVTSWLAIISHSFSWAQKRLKANF